MTDTAGLLLYAIFAIGGAGVYFALPRSGRSTGTAGAILGLAAVALLVVFLVAKTTAPARHVGFSYVFSAVALLAAGRVITHPKPVYSAVYFVLVVVAVAFLVVMHQAEFLAVALIIVYAGAIVVTYAFVIMLAQQSGASPYDTRAREPFWAVLAGFVTMAAVAGQIDELPTGSMQPAEGPVRLVADSAPTQVPAAQASGNTMAIGQAVLTNYVITLEVAGVLLLVAIIGAIAIAKKSIPAEEVPVDERPLGEAGREVPPF